MAGTPSEPSPSAPLADRAALMMVSKLISHGCFLLIAVVLARALTLAEFGTFNQVWFVNKSLFYLFSLGLPVSVYYFLPRLAQAEQKNFIAQTMAGLTVLALPFAIGMFVLADPLALYFQNPALASQMRLFALWPLVTVPTVCTDAILLSLGLTTRAAVFEIVTKLGMIAAVTAAAFAGQGLQLVFIALIAYGVAQSILALWMVWQPLRGVSSRLSPAGWRSQLAYAAPYGFGTLAAALNWQVDKVVVSLYFPPEAFAIYAAGALEIPLAGVTSVVVLSVVMPEFTRRYHVGDVDGFVSLWRDSMLKLALPVFAVAGYMMVFAGPMVRTAFSDQYAASVLPFQIYLLFLPLRITVWSQVLAATGETKAVLYAQLAAMAVNIVLAFALVRWVGWLGCAAAALFADYLFSALLLRQIARRLRRGAISIVPWNGLGRVAILTVAVGVACLPVAWLNLPDPWAILVGFLLFASIFTLAGRRAGLITGADLVTVARWLGAGPSVRKAVQWPS